MISMMARAAKIFRWFGKTVKWCFIVFLVFLGSLFFREQRFPGVLVRRLERSLSSPMLRVSIGETAFSFRSGLAFRQLALFSPLGRIERKPFAAAEEVRLDFLARRLVVVGAVCPFLHAGYYNPGYGDHSSGAESAAFAFPRLPRFELVLEHPAILGIEAERVTGEVVVERTRAEVRRIHIDWPEREEGKLALDGFCTVDLAAHRVVGEVRGEAVQPQIRPLMEVLDIPVAMPYFDAFTAVEGPVRASCGWDVDLSSCDYTLDLDLHPQGGRYNGVPLKRVDGKVKVMIDFEPGVMLSEVTVGPLVALDRRGGTLAGELVTHCVSTSETVRIDFDAESTFGQNDLLDVIGYLNDGILDDLCCDERPYFSARGTLGVGPHAAALTDLGGRLAVAKGRLFGLELHDASADWTYRGEDFVFTNVVTRGRSGGVIGGDARFHLPAAAEGEFAVRLKCEKGSLGEFTVPETFDLGERRGELTGAVALSGPLATNALARLAGRGRFAVKDGYLAQMTLFLGLTQLLADYVPGVSLLVNQTDAQAEYTIEGGVIRFKNFVIEGSIVSISATGTYDLDTEFMDFKVQVRILKEESVLGKFILRPLLWPVTKTLFEFGLKGSLKEPQWRILELMERVR